MTSIAAFAEPVVLEVIGIPQPQGNKRPLRNPHGNGRIQMVEGRSPEASRRFHSWRDAVSDVARDWQKIHNVALLDEPCRLTCVFRLPKPQSAGKKRIWPSTRPDVSKLVRAVEDSLKGILYTDDSRVCELIVRKTYAVDVPPGCTITLEVLD